MNKDKGPRARRKSFLGEVLPSSQIPASYGLLKTTSSLKRCSELEKTMQSGSGLRLTFDGSTFPPKESWLKSGLVERQMLSSDMVWNQRLMVLTSDAIYFSKEGSVIVLDKFELQSVAFVGKVEPLFSTKVTNT